MLTNAKATATLPVVNIQRARKFYEEKLGLKPVLVNSAGTEWPDVTYKCGGDTTLYLYQRAATKADHTVASFELKDVEKEVKELKAKGVVFEEYDMPGLKTVNSIATWNLKDKGVYKAAWFKDTEGNILALNEMASVLPEVKGKAKSATRA